MHSNYYVHSHGKLHYWYQHGSKPTLIFFHAAGFHGYLWKSIADNFRHHEIILIDLPGHGKSDPLSAHFDWEETALLLGGFLDSLHLLSAIGIGHSMGGHMALSLAGQRNDFNSVLALDPVVLTLPMINAFANGDYTAINNKRAAWSTQSAFIHDYGKKAFFKDWSPSVFTDYCTHALKETADGFQLACNPAYEASIYCNTHSDRLYEQLPNIHCPTRIVRSRDRRPDEAPVSFSYSPIRDSIGDFIANCDVETLGDYSHFFPMQNPLIVINEIRTLLSVEKEAQELH
ncbi:alpha/beta hydrolase [Alcanivorax sp.]|jgi:pimeloyl-ACP methyl ester carboxylesterase|uniref:alpha/beta fold hydrolase n=1 Tax=Alcanivorax sp. TaxID=1872427 RepID=UPI0032D8FEA9